MGADLSFFIANIDEVRRPTATGDRRGRRWMNPPSAEQLD